ncbi:MAG: F0F1 ATP synthase subunit B [Thermodesulfobacteriota bacterium]
MKKGNWSKLGGALLSALTLLALATVAQASGDAHGGGGIPAEKLWDLLYRVLNFAALVFILVYFLRKPLSSGLNSRREAIQDQLDSLESRKAEAEQLYREAEGRLAKLDAEVEAIIAEAVKQGEAEKAKIIADAERAAGDIKRQADMAVAHELAEAKTRLKAEVAEQAVLLAEELIKKNIQPDDQTRMVEASLARVGGIQ